MYELLAVYIALRLWSQMCQHKRLLIRSNNMSTVFLLNSGKCEDKQMLSIARNIWLVFAENNIQIKAVHLTSVQNRDADMLSRWYIDSHDTDQAIDSHDTDQTIEAHDPDIIVTMPSSL